MGLSVLDPPNYVPVECACGETVLIDIGYKPIKPYLRVTISCTCKRVYAVDVHCLDDSKAHGGD